MAERSKRGEETVLETLRFLSTLLSNLPGMAYRCRNDTDWTMEFASEGCLALTGYHPSEFTDRRRSFAQLIHPADREGIWHEVQSAIEQHRPFELVYRITAADGKQKWVWERGRAVYLPDHRLVLEGFITDVTEQKRQEEELRASERQVHERTIQLERANRRLGAQIKERRAVAAALLEEKDLAEGIIETAQAIILVLDLRGRIVRYNPYMEEISGYRLEEVQDKDWFATFLPERDRERIRELFEAVLSARETRGLNPIITKDGQERLIDWSNRTLKDTSGNMIGVLSIGQDVTERERARRWLETLIDTSQDAVISINRQGEIGLFNPSAERIFGWTAAEIQGQKVNMLMAEPYVTEHDDYIERYEQTGEARAIGRVRTVEGRRGSGEVFPMELSVTRVAAGEEVIYAAFIRDISEKSRLQDQLIEKERLAAVGATTASLAHEIRNPLNGMYITAQVLQRRIARQREALGSGTEETIRNLMAEIARLDHLLEEFSFFARREKYNFQPVSMGSLYSEVYALEEETFRNRGIRVEQDVPSGLPLVRADRDRLKQAMLNLCKNAVEAMPNGGMLMLRAHNSGGNMVLEIADTGTGIPDGVNIYEPFNTTKPSGAGLGLMVVRKIVAAHGGSITHESERGKETTFRITLPLED